MVYKNLDKKIKEVVKPINTVINVNDTIDQALIKLIEKNIDPKISYFYVIDNENHLLGVVSTRKLLLKDRTTEIADLMDTNLITLEEDQTLKEALELFYNFRLLAFPVVDNEGRLLGIIDIDIYVEEPCELTSSKQKWDVFQLIGYSLEDERRGSIFKRYFMRLPWLFCSLIGGLFCAWIANLHRAVLSQVLMLAMFLPLILALSEAISIQSMTSAIHYLKRPRINLKIAFARGFKELKVVFLVGITAGIAVAFSSLFFKGGGFLPTLAIGLSIIVSVLFSSAFGMLFPLAMSKSKLDFKVASGPLVLMMADIFTVILYLGFASYLIL